MPNVFQPDFDPADDSDQEGFANRRARIGRRVVGYFLDEQAPGEK
jgi:hypothetical protein